MDWIDLKKLFPIAVFIVVALASVAMAGFAYFAAQEAARFKFEASADDALNRIESRVDLNLSLLRATRALFEAEGGDISRLEFRAFFNALDVSKDYRGLRGIGFLPLVKRGEEAGIEQSIQRNHGVARSLFPSSDLAWRAPVVLFEPLDEAGLKGIGFDMMTDPERRGVIEKASSSGELEATGRLLLGKATGSEAAYPGFLVFSRVKSVPGAKTDASTWSSGVVYAAFRSTDLFGSALGLMPLLPVNVEIYDGAAPDGDNLLYRSEAPPAPAYADVVVERRIEVGGRQWTVLFRPTAAFSLPTSRGLPAMLGLSGLLLAGAIGMVALYQSRAYDAASKLHETAEKSLLEKDFMLQEMKHRIKNSIARVLAMARQTAANAKDIGEFSASFSSRLQAMAASQDMLTRSRWQKVDLGELLHIELGQIFGKDLPESLLKGPKVLLDETVTQALGLTFHELATNALKYGHAGNSVDALTVTWRVDGAGADRKLQLIWSETGGKAIVAPQKVGFGTKLIDMNITRELDGSIERDFRDDGLVVEIVIPLQDSTGK